MPQVEQGCSFAAPCFHCNNIVRCCSFIGRECLLVVTNFVCLIALYQPVLLGFWLHGLWPPECFGPLWQSGPHFGTHVVAIWVISECRQLGGLEYIASYAYSHTGPRGLHIGGSCVKFRLHQEDQWPILPIVSDADTARFTYAT